MALRFPLTSEDPIAWLEEIDVVDVVDALFVLLAAYVLAALVDRALSRLADRLLADRFRLTVLIPVVKVLIYGVAAYWILFRSIGPSQQFLVAFAGLFGAALGFGLRDIVADAIGGIVLILERPYRIGDVVSIGPYDGEVVDIGLRSTRIETLDDTLITVPNDVFFQEAIANENAGNAEMLVEIEFYVSPEADLTTATRIVQEGLATSQYVYVTESCPIDVRVGDEPFCTKVRGKAYVNDLRNRGAFESDVTRRVLEAFEEAGIESATPPPPEESR